jgi:ATP/maltotriose-dependent transcriptional regulator MalT
VERAELVARGMENLDEARRLRRAEREALGDRAPGLAAALTLALAGERGQQGDHAATRALAEQARAEARAAGNRPLEALAATVAADRAHCELRRLDPDALAVVDAQLAEAGAMVDALPDEQVAERLQILVSLTIARLFTGDFPGAHAAVGRGVMLARRTGQGLLAPGFVALRGHVAYELGRLDAATADAHEALESASISGNVKVAYWASISLSRVALARGRIDAALEHGRAAWEHLGDRAFSQAGFVVADARLAAGDAQGAAAALDAFGWLRPQLWTLNRVKAVEVAVRVLLAEGRVDEAAAWAPRAAAEGGGRRTGAFGAIGAHAEAAVLLARGDPPEAARVALAGAAEADHGAAPLWAGRCRTLAGAALSAGGRTLEARAELRRAAADLEHHGAWGYRDAALRALRRLGDRPRPATRATQAPRDGDGRLGALTRREREVAELVAAGRTNAQIAARLHVREGTVEKHVSSTLAKLGLATRAGIIALLAARRPAD